MEFIDLSQQLMLIRPNVDAAIARVLDHGRFIMGPEVEELETGLSEIANSTHCISCSNGTDAIVMALMALEIGAGDAVVCPSFTFAATAEAIALVGAKPVFLDIAENTFNLDHCLIEEGVQYAKAAGLQPKAVIAVDMFGVPACYTSLKPIAQEHKLKVIADAAQSFGARAGNEFVGSMADITTTSFFPAKPLGCFGDGGAVFTNDPTVADSLRSIRVHGKGSDKYENVRVGLNARLDTLQAAILLEKLKLLATEIEKRQTIADIYSTRLKDLVQIPTVPSNIVSAWAQYTIRVNRELRTPLQEFLRQRNIPTAIYYSKPLHKQQAYEHMNVGSQNLPITDLVATEVLSLPMHPYISTDQQNEICDAIVEFSQENAMISGNSTS